MAHNGAGPVSAVTEIEARKVYATGGRHATFKLHSRKTQIVAELIGSDTYAVLGIVAHGNTPVLAWCRRLIDFGYRSDHRLEAFREATLCLRIRPDEDCQGCHPQRTGCRCQ